MGIVKFQQDVEKPIGWGNAIDETGKATYVFDPETASKFIDTMPGQGGAPKQAAPGAAPSSIALQNPTPTGVAKVGAGVPTPAPEPITSVGGPAPAPTAAPGTPMGKVQAFIGMGGPKPGAAPAAPGAPPAPGAPGDAGKVQGALANPAAPPPALPVSAPAAPSAPLGSAPAAGAAPLGTGAGVLELAGTTDTSSGSVVKGRDKNLAAADVAAMEKTGAETDAAMLDMGKRQDERALGALDIEKQGLQGVEERNRNQIIDEQLKLDPDAYMKRMSTGKKLGMVILAALNGGFGSLIGQKGNGVLDGVDDAINKDIDKQKSEIAAGRTRIGNDIAEFMRKGHDAETAEMLARDRANSAVDQMFGLDAKRMGIQGQQLEQQQLLVKQRGEQRAELRAQKMKETEDRATTQWQKTRTMQQKPTGKPLSEKEFYETKKAELDYRNAALDTMTAAEVAQTIGKPGLSPQEAQRIKDRVKEVGAGINETSGAVDMTKNLVEGMGGKIDVTTGKIEWPSDIKGVGWWDKSNIVGGPLEKAGLTYTDATRVKDSQAALLEYITSNLTGATATPEQRATFTNMAGADLGNEQRAKEQLQNWANTLFSLRNDQMARLGPDGQRYFAASQAQAKQGSGAPPLQERGQPAPAPAAPPPAAPARPPAPTYTPNNSLQLVSR